MRAPAEPREGKAFGVAVATLFFLCSWVLLGHGFYAHGRISDVGTYQGYGLQIRNGELPYRDFAVEYPPGSLPAFVAPTYVGQPTVPADYDKWFARIMALCGLACLGFVFLARAAPAAAGFVAASPLFVGWLMPTRFDLWPMALVTAAVAAFVRDRHRLGWLALALALAVKLFAVVLVPVAAVWTLRRRGGPELARGVTIGAAAAAAVFAPFAIAAPHGVWESVWGQVSRPLQIESLPASVLTTFGKPPLALAAGSVSLAGYHTLRIATGAAQVAVLVALWIGFARGPATEARLLRYGAACVCAFVAFAKVLSPQYLIWLVPLVPLVRGKRGIAASALLAAAAIETQFWLQRSRYAEYTTHFRFAELVLLRNLVLVGILAVLALPARQRSRPDPS